MDIKSVETIKTGKAICEVCGSEIITKSKGVVIYCSTKCRQKGSNEKTRLQNQEKFLKEKELLEKALEERTLQEKVAQEKREDEDYTKGIVKWLVDVYDETGETVAIATILTMVKMKGM